MMPYYITRCRMTRWDVTDQDSRRGPPPPGPQHTPAGPPRPPPWGRVWGRPSCLPIRHPTSFPAPLSLSSPAFFPLLPNRALFPREGVFTLSVSHLYFNPPGWGRKVYFLPSPPCNCLRKNQNQPKTPICQSVPEASGQMQLPRPRPAPTSLSQRCPAAGTGMGFI